MTGLLMVAIMVLTGLTGLACEAMTPNFRKRLGAAAILALAVATVLGYMIAVLALPSVPGPVIDCPGPPYAVC